eukprot:GHVU01118111.1.p1 GENE.GHVU01118111.1~~GHVU01118111.1.p1  ORF type:complete len:199 (-),score=36.77 GHVU01118111.1:176-772(-)
MFKKVPSVGSQSLIGGKDKKRLTASFDKPHLDNEEFREQIRSFFNSFDSLTLVKLQSPKAALHVAADGTPLVIDGLPTVYTLWRLPELLPCFVVPEPVSRFVLRGADLMLPGIYRRTDGSSVPVKAGSMAAVRVAGNRFPFAVGYAECTGHELQRLSPGMKGRGLRLIHYYSDGIWYGDGIHTHTYSLTHSLRGSTHG